jgi:hypothetical protein
MGWRIGRAREATVQACFASGSEDLQSKRLLVSLQSLWSGRMNE